MQSSQVEDLHACSFDEMMAPLERKSGQRLNGEHRLICMQAFEECPEGCRRCAEKALRIADDPVGLFVKMIKKDREHLRVSRSAAPDAPRAPLERMLSWAERTAPLLAPEHREEILDEAGLSADEREQVRAAIARSLERPEAA